MSIWLITVAISMWRFAVLSGGEIADLEHRDRFAFERSTIWLPAKFVSTQFDQSVSKEEIVHCEILGTKITGVSRCTGCLVSSIEGGKGSADIRCVLKGTIECDNMGRNGPANIDSTTSTSFSAIKIVRFDGIQLTTWPTELNVTTTLKITNVDTHLKGVKGIVVKRIAVDRVEATKEEVRAIAETLTKKRPAEKIDGEFERQLSHVNLAIKVCRTALAQIANREIQILTRISKENSEVGIALVTSEVNRR